MMFGKILGVDIGYGFVKVFNESTEIIFPSVVGLGHNLSFLSQLSSYKSSLDNISMEYNGKTYFVGDYAVRQSSIPSRSLDIKRPEDINTLLLFLTAMGIYTTEQRQQFNIVTGLPTNFISSYQSQLESLLTGDHTFRINKTGAFEEKNITVSKIKVVPQPFGTLFNQVLNSSGQVAEKEMANMLVGVADIGFKTSDFVVSDKLEFVGRLSTSSTSGMVNAYQFISSIIREEYKIDKKDYDLDKIVKDKALKISGKNIDISDIISTAFSNLAAKIKTELDSIWDYRELDCILLTGGGGEALSDYLMPHFNNMKLVDSPQFSNVKGFWKLGKHTFQ